LPTYPFQHQRFWPRAAENPAGLSSPGSAAEAGFWAAVDGGDAVAGAAALGADPAVDASWRAVLPALSSWRRAQRDRSVVEGWRYRVVWKPVIAPSPKQVDGSFLVLAPAVEVLGQVVQALAGFGARVVVLDPGSGERAGLTGRIRAALPEGEPVAGVVSLAALDESPLEEHSEVPAGLAVSLALVQALETSGSTPGCGC
jgi:candicidin polyketide synthase FscB